MTKLLPAAALTFAQTTIALDTIVYNPANPRKHFDQAKLEELAAGIAANGILQPPAVRPLDGKYCLIWGERRTRAAKLAGLKQISVKIYDVDEVKAAELALIENDDREDLTPLERAEGYRDLQKKHGLTVDQIAAQVNKGRASVYSAIKLCDLVEAGKKAIAEQELLPSIGELIAALPDRTHQLEVVQKALGTFGESWKQTKVKLSFREVKELIRDEYMLRLDKAPFDITDPGLVPGAGACDLCPKRSDAEGRDDTGPASCLDRSCNARKVAAHKREVISEAKAESRPVLNAADSKAALGPTWRSAWVKVTDSLGKTTVAAAIKGTDLEPQLAVSESGRLVKVLKKSEVKKALLAKGSKLADDNQLDHSGFDRGAGQTKEEKEAAEKTRAAREAAELVHKKVAQAAIAMVVEHIEKKGLSGDLLRLVVAKVVSSGSSRDAYERRGLKLAEHWPSEEDFHKHFAGANDREMLGMLFEVCDEEVGDSRNGEYSGTLANACELAGVDLSKIEEEMAPKPKPGESGWVCPRGCGKPYGEHAGTACPKAAKKKRGTA